MESDPFYCFLMATSAKRAMYMDPGSGLARKYVNPVGCLFHGYIDAKTKHILLGSLGKMGFAFSCGYATEKCLNSSTG